MGPVPALLAPEPNEAELLGEPEGEDLREPGGELPGLPLTFLGFGHLFA